ncbi:hypothetical protein BCR36DRAFT_587783, partial [Piromyces finnis]
MTTTDEKKNQVKTEDKEESTQDNNEEKKELTTNNDKSTAEGEIKPRKRRKKRKENGQASAMKSELLITARNKLSFDKTKRVRRWVRQPISFNTLSGNIELSIWHTDEPKKLPLDKVL